MKKILHYSIVAVLATVSFLSAKAQNQVYWREGFSTFVISADPAASTATQLEPGEAGTWKTYGVWRTTGTGCTYPDGVTGNPHIRSTSNAGLVDTAYIISPLVSFGINEFHMIRSRTTRKYTIYTTTDTDINTTNWTLVSVWPKSALAPAVTCTDTMALINSATAKRVQIRFERAGNSDIDSVYLTSVNTIMPVKFGAINLSQANGLTKVDWNVLSEINTDKYFIERSETGADFSAIGSLTAINAAKYTYIDSKPLTGTGYYRIKALDKDGSIGYSSVVKIGGKKTAMDIAIAPNPVKGGQLNVQLNSFEKGTYSFNLYDATGRQVFTKAVTVEAANGVQTLQLPSTVQNGVYQLQVTNGNSKMSKTVMVQ